MLQYVAVYCDVMQCVAVRCIKSKSHVKPEEVMCVAACRSLLQCVRVSDS